MHIDRFEAKVIKTSRCWYWIAAWHHTGYGAFSIDGISIPAHRAAWLLYRGPIPEGLSVLHRCDQPLCVNPSHLFLGTHADNMADMAAKGRAIRGESSPKAKLTEDEALLIKAAPPHITNTEMARALGVSYWTVYRIRKGQRWTYLDPKPQLDR